MSLFSLANIMLIACNLINHFTSAVANTEILIHCQSPKVPYTAFHIMFLGVFVLTRTYLRVKVSCLAIPGYKRDLMSMLLYARTH